MTVTFYVSMTCIPFMIVVALVSGQDISYIQHFTFVDYVNLTLACICYLVTTTFVFLKSKNVDVGTFSPLSQGNILFTAMLDVFIFHYDFSKGQLIGMTIIFLVIVF